MYKIFQHSATALAAGILFTPAFAQNDPALAPVTVLGTRPDSAYKADTAGAATRTDTPQRETPQSVRIVPRQLIDDISAKRLDQTIDYVSGITRQNSFGGLWDNVAIRGLAGSDNTGLGFLVNGFAGNRGFNAPRDTANIERIEFLKGPNSALYGSAEPGGTLNIVTKKPRFAAAHAVNLALDAFGNQRLSLDTTGGLNQALAYRFNAAFEERDTQRQYVHARRHLLAPALSWLVSEATTVHYESEFLRQQAPLDRGVVAVNGKLGAMSDKTFLGEPTDGDITVDNQTHQLSLEHEHTTNWRSRLGFSYKNGSLQGYSTEASALQTDQQTLRRQRRYRDNKSDDRSLQGEVAGQFTTGALKHELLVGLETYQFQLDQQMLRINPSASAPYAIDIYNPVYGQPAPTPLPNTNTLEHQHNHALFAQDQMHLSARWRLLVGARADQYLQRLENRRTGTIARQDHNAFSPRVGLVHLATQQVSLYANASTSFRPNSGTDFAGTAFSPEKGRSFEGGIKYESSDQKLGLNAALFDTRKRNVLTADPLNSGFSQTTGQVRSRGLEVDLSGQLGQHWRLSASYTHLDAEILRDTTLANGTRLLNIPRNSANALAVYEQPLKTISKLGLGGGAVYMGKRAGDANASFDLPSYTTAKLLSYWQIDKTWRVALDVDNVFDKKYYASSFNALWVAPGTRRTITLGISAKL